MNLHLIRHGESKGNETPETYFQMNDWEIPLSEKGGKQAQKVGRKLKRIFRYHIPIITSPYVRAKQTTDIIVSNFDHAKIIESPLIRERDWGNLREEVESFATREERNHLFDFYYRPVGGESFADVYQRAMVFLNFVLPQHKHHSNLVIVSHGEFIKVLRMILDGDTVEEFGSLPNIKNCEIIERYINV